MLRDIARVFFSNLLSIAAWILILIGIITLIFSLYSVIVIIVVGVLQLRVVSRKWWKLRSVYPMLDFPYQRVPKSAIYASIASKVPVFSLTARGWLERPNG